ncbi:hypothetical protein RND81_09G257700 [Saponaria officinalis]|uniref:Uncharacterized protein n=1 Tax=Saponaria officinalis TaxID=3572 RepID=A0AAW1ISL4_SAPOF
MAYKRKAYDEKLFEGLSPQGKEFVLPNIRNPWLSEEFSVNPHIRLKSYPIRSCDDSFLFKTLAKPSVPLVASVEKFFLGHSDSPLSDFDGKSFIDVPVKYHVGSRFHSYSVYDTKIGILPDSGRFQNAKSNACTSIGDLQFSSDHPEPSSMNELSAADPVQLRNLHVN